MIAGLFVASCGSSTVGTNGTASTTTTRAPLPAGRLPSTISKMVCSKKAETEIADALGQSAQVQTPTWVDHLYVCRFFYSASVSLGLSVKELSSWAQTFSYFRTLQAQLGNSGTVNGLGQGAFQAPAGDIVVRKDWKVLLVDVSGLPSRIRRSSDIIGRCGRNSGRRHLGMLGWRLNLAPRRGLAVGLLAPYVPPVPVSSAGWAWCCGRRHPACRRSAVRPSCHRRRALAPHPDITNWGFWDSNSRPS